MKRGLIAGPLDTPWFTVCQILITPRLWERKAGEGERERERGKEGGSKKRNKGIHEYLGKKRRFRCHVGGECGAPEFISSHWQIEVWVPIALDSTSPGGPASLATRPSSFLSAFFFDSPSLFLICFFLRVCVCVCVSLSWFLLITICGRWNKGSVCVFFFFFYVLGVDPALST